MNCPNCGKEIDENKKFCPKCGFDLRKNNLFSTKNLIIASVISAILLVLIFTFLFQSVIANFIYTGWSDVIITGILSIILLPIITIAYKQKNLTTLNANVFFCCILIFWIYTYYAIRVALYLIYPERILIISDATKAIIYLLMLLLGIVFGYLCIKDNNLKTKNIEQSAVKKIMVTYLYHISFMLLYSLYGTYLMIVEPIGKLFYFSFWTIVQISPLVLLIIFAFICKNKSRFLAKEKNHNELS